MSKLKKLSPKELKAERNLYELKDLKEGDSFIYKNMLYEIIRKYEFSSYCKCLNDKYRIGDYQMYLYCSFSNDIKVEL